MPSPAFEEAARRAFELKKRPSNDDLLSLYALYKQATEGDVRGKRPSRLKIKDRSKYDAWAALQGTPPDVAEERYIALVDRLAAG